MSSTRNQSKLKFDTVPADVNYFDLPYVSNSDLSSLKDETGTREQFGDKEKAYAFGSLFDAVVTEPERINVLKKTFDGEAYDPIDMMVADKMKDSFFEDVECRQLLMLSHFQTVMVRKVPLVYRDVSFVLHMRCKWDGWIPGPWWGWDLKSTTATTQEQFEAACEHFDYDRQRAVYMTIAGSDQDMLVGVSKVNFKVFKKRIRKGDAFYRSGMSKFLHLGLKYHVMYGY